MVFRSVVRHARSRNHHGPKSRIVERTEIFDRQFIMETNDGFSFERVIGDLSTKKKELEKRNQPLVQSKIHQNKSRKRFQSRRFSSKH
jgi:hypothetical protein